MASAAEPPRPQELVADLARLVVVFRLVTLLVSAAYLALTYDTNPQPVLPVLAILLGVGNLLVLVRWDRLAAFVLRHPTLLALDYVVTVGTLLLTGTDGPFLTYALGTAFLAGILYGWLGAVIFAVLLVAGHVYVLDLRAVLDLQPGFQGIFGAPSLYLLLALGAAAVRGLLLRQSAMEVELASAVSDAAAISERARLAREMHDTLGKTLHGIALIARTLPEWVARQPDRAVREARSLAAAAESAAGQARELIADLRSEALDLPLDQAVDDFARTWSDASGIPVRTELEPVLRLTPRSRYELFCVVKEALRNVERHAAAGSADVTLTVVDGAARLVVSDDGAGLAGQPDLDALAADGHFGLLGMRERAERAGGVLDISPREPSGTTLTVSVPLGADEPALPRVGTWSMP